MKLYNDQYQYIAKIMDKHNEVMPENPMTLANFINGSAEYALSNKDTNWDKINGINYKFPQYKLADISKTRDIKLKYNTYKAVSDKIGGFPTDLYARIDKMNNVVAGIISETDAYRWQLRSDILAHLNHEQEDDVTTAWEKDIINNNGWDIDKLMKVLEAIGAVDDEDDYTVVETADGDRYKTQCPLCDRGKHHSSKHASWIINPEPGEIPHYSCAKSQGEESGTLIQLLEESTYASILKGIHPYTLIYDVLYRGRTVITDKLDYEADDSNDTDKTKNKEAMEREKRKIIDEILNDCSDDYWYLHRQGFKDEDIDRCGVYYRDFTVNPGKGKAAWWSNMMRGCLIYAVRDNWDIVGFKARRTGYKADKIQDKQADIDKIAEEDEWFKKCGNDLAKVVKFNLKGTDTSENLFLLDVYQKEGAYMSCNKLVIVEGEKDALRIYKYIKDTETAVVASYGNNLTDSQLQLMTKRFKPDQVKVVLAYDNDSAGASGNIIAYKQLTDLCYDVSYGLYVKDDRKDAGDMYWRTAKNGRNMTWEKLIDPLVNCNMPISEYMEIILDRGFCLTERAIQDLDDVSRLRYDQETFDYHAEERSEDWYKQLKRLQASENITIDSDAEIELVCKIGLDAWRKDFEARYNLSDIETDAQYTLMMLMDRVDQIAAAQKEKKKEESKEEIKEEKVKPVTFDEEYDKDLPMEFRTDAWRKWIWDKAREEMCDVEWFAPTEAEKLKEMSFPAWYLSFLNEYEPLSETGSVQYCMSAISDYLATGLMG